MSARTEARAAGSPGEVGSRLLVSWSLVEGQVPGETSGKGCVLILPQPWDVGSTWISLVDEPGVEMWRYVGILLH